METFADALRNRVRSMLSRLRDMSEAEVTHKPGADKWCKKEILGHLIDSACNNHQRFVRAQFEVELSFPSYEQDGWARCQGYANSDWPLLVNLWSAYNRHLADVIARLPSSALTLPCRIGDGEAVTLAFLVEDYVRHLDHHLAQLDRTTPL